LKTCWSKISTVYPFKHLQHNIS